MKKKDSKQLSRKTPQHSTLENNMTTKVYYDDAYLDMFSFKRKPVNAAFVERLAQELIQWATKDEDALKMSQFYIARGITNQDFDRWRTKHECLKEAALIALEAIGNRREAGAVKGKYNAALVGHMMPHYDKDWKDMAEWKSALKQKEDGKTQGPITIVMEDYVKRPEGND